MQCQIGSWQTVLGALWPFDQLEPCAGEGVPKSRLFPLARVVEAVKVKVRDVDMRPLEFTFMRLDDCIGRAFDTALHTQGAQ